MIHNKNMSSVVSKDAVQKVKYDRVHLLSKEDAEELNTYLNFGVFPTFAETYKPVYRENSYERASEEEASGTPGVRSLFNRAGAVILGFTEGSGDGYNDIDIRKGEPKDTHYWRIGNNVPLMDSPRARQRIRRSSGCSIKELVRDSQNGFMGQETYAYSDFMYCKHLGKVSNNYMVTLRRFPLPVDDYIGAYGEALPTDKCGWTDNDGSYSRLDRSAKNSPCIGCMVTWMGVSGNELSNILKYNYKMPFKELEASFEQGQNIDADANTGLLSSMFSVFDSQYQKQYQAGYASTSANAFFSHLGIGSALGDAPYKGLANLRDERTKVWGPIDSIRHVYYRDDKGLTFEQKITLVFEYELRSYNGINGRQAMLDLISNILNVTYTTGSFWGGGHRGFGAHQSNIFANLNIFKARGGFTNFVDAFALDLVNLSDKLQGYFAEGDALTQLKGLLNQVGGMLMSGVLNKLGRPQKGFYNALLSPAPIGFWHVTIGNPKRPIMSIGNMIITNVQFEHNGPLGIDDFPTGIKVTVDLDRGKARDLRDIERLYMQGNDRIYSSMGDKVIDMYKNSILYKEARKVDISKYTPQISSNGGSLESQTTPPANTPNESSVPGTTEGAPQSSEKTLENSNAQSVPAETLEGILMKYFGTSDKYSILVPAAEQEYGSGKKPSTEANGNLNGGQ